MITDKSIESILDHVDPSYYHPELNSKRHRYITDGNYYEWYYTVAQHYKPTSYLEIGVRFGYSTLAVLAGASGSVELMRGYDNESYEKGSNAKASANINKFAGDDVDVNIITQSTQELNSIDGFWDLVHVDGAHGYGGCQHDMDLLIDKCKVMIIDDYSSMCRKSVDDYVKEHSDKISKSYSINTDRGLMVLELKHKELIL
ncbi:MAG: class I SAM-dependent methyltransferase [Candidatus Thorarchaeota archaeon]|jgi:predicted O-methyltransferase YrrM